MAVIEPTVDKLNEPTVMLQIRNVAKAVDNNLNAVNDEMTDIQNQINQMEDVSSRVDALEDDMQTAQQAITEIQQKDTEQDTAIQNNENGLVTGTELSYANGQLTLKLTRQAGDITDTVDVPFFKTVTLIPTTTDRAFKLQFTMWDDSVYDTNEFVIPAGGGTDVSVTGVTVEDGSADNSFKVSIQLSDGTPIDSNDYPFPTQAVSPYPTSATLALSGNTLNLTIGLSNSNNVTGSIDLSPILANYVTDTELTQVQSDLQEQISGLKLTSNGNIMSINGTTAPIVNSISGSVSNGNLKITVNGITSADIPLPKSGLEYIEFVRETVSGTFTVSNETEVNALEIYITQYNVSDTFILPARSDIPILVTNAAMDPNIAIKSNNVFKSVYTITADESTLNNFREYLNSVLATLSDGNYKISVSVGYINDIYPEQLGSEKSYFTITKSGTVTITSDIKISADKSITSLKNPTIVVVGVIKA